MGPLKATNQVRMNPDDYVTNGAKEPKLQSKLETERKHRSLTWPCEAGKQLCEMRKLGKLTVAEKLLEGGWFLREEDFSLSGKRRDMTQVNQVSGRK